MRFGPAAAVGAAVLIVAAGLSMAVEHQERSHLTRALEDTAATLGTELSGQVARRIRDLKRMASRAEARGGTPRGEWEADALAYLQDDPAYLSLAWVAPDMRLRWRVPQAGSAQLEGRDLSREEVAGSALQASLRRARATVSRAFRGADGESSVLVVLPVYLELELGGFLVCELSVAALADPVMSSGASRGYSVTMVEASSRTVIHGAPSEPPGEWSARAVAELPDRRWDLVVRPRPDHLELVRSHLPLVGLLIGSVLAVLMAGTMTLLIRSRGQARQLEEVNLELERANDALARMHRAVSGDLHESEAAHRALERQVARTRRLEAIGSLAGGIAHDFNNLLQVITLHADDLERLLPTASPGRPALAEIRSTARRSTKLVQQLLAFGRRQVLQPRVLDLDEIVTSMQQMLRRTLDRGIDLELSLSPDAGRVRADRSQVERVLMNLVLNARDAMGGAGRIRIETAEVVLGCEAAPEYSHLKPGRFVALRVRDWGPGIPEGDLERIFEPFFSTKDEGIAGGLGLSTVYGIVQQSGGEVLVHSQPGEGTTFEVLLPYTSEPVAAAPAPPSALAPTPGATSRDEAETILLVEDDASLRRVVRRTLERLGYRVLDAPGVPAALALASEHSGALDLLVTDVLLPGVNGRELADRLLADFPGLQVLFMSGYTELEFIRRVGEEGPVRFLQKPFGVSDLADAVREALGG